MINKNISVPRINEDILRDKLQCVQNGWRTYRDGTVLPSAAELIKAISEASAQSENPKN